MLIRCLLAALVLACFPLSLAVADGGAAATPRPGLKRPSAWGRNTAGALLPVDEAFQLLPAERRGNALHLEWNVAPGYYLYQHRLGVEVLSPAGVQLGKPRLPPGLKYQDEHFGQVDIYRGLLQADYVVKGKSKQPLRLKVTYQGCADLGVCYPPQEREVEARAAR